MLKIDSTNFKADTKPTQSTFNPANRQPQQAPIPYENDSLELMTVQNDMQKKQKQQEKLQKVSAYGTAAIGAGIIGSLLLAIFTMIKNKGKSPAEDEMKKLTEVALDWIDFKTQKGSVAPLNSKTTAKALRDAFNGIIDSSKLSEAAKKWGGRRDGGTDIIYLYGHGGTGKTYVAEQFAQEINAIFTSIKYPDMGSPFKDAASMKISNTFKNIENMANKNKDRQVVVCIDEFDAVIKKVNEARSSDEANKSRAAVLTGIDAIRKKCKNVTFVTTSNYHPKNGQVDEIALRRFNKQIEVPLSNKEQIKALLEMYFKDVEQVGAVIETDFLKTSAADKFADKLQKEGYSNGEIALIVQEAANMFKASLKDVPDAELKTKHPFKIEFLEKALKMKGQAASKTNKLMDVNPDGSNQQAPFKLSKFKRIILTMLNLN